jgi:hypothetical protein
VHDLGEDAVEVAAHEGRLEPPGDLAVVLGES